MHGVAQRFDLLNLLNTSLSPILFVRSASFNAISENGTIVVLALYGAPPLPVSRRRRPTSNVSRHLKMRCTMRAPSQSEKRTRCSAATKAAARPGRSCPRYSTRKNYRGAAANRQGSPRRREATCVNRHQRP